jgi:hypothetical protein
MIERNVIDRDKSDPQQLHEVTTEQVAVLQEEKTDWQTLHELEIEEKFHSDWDADLRKWSAVVGCLS